MSKTNPEKAIAALIPAPIDCGAGVCVRPLTLAAFALLERIESPMLTGKKGDTFSNLETLYVLSHTPAECLACDNIATAAIAWADTLPPDIIAPMVVAAEKQIRAMLDVIPEPSEKSKKKAKGTTAG